MIPSGRLIPHAAVVLAILVWSSSFIALKIALSAYSPLTVMAGRMLAASLICLPLLPPVLRFARRSPLRRILLHQPEYIHFGGHRHIHRPAHSQPADQFFTALGVDTGL